MLLFSRITWIGNRKRTSRGMTDEKPTYEDHPEFVSPSVILYEIGRCRDTGEFGGHDTYSRRFVELLCMPRTLHSRLRVFSMTLMARINLDSTQQLKPL